jgi:8-oxo-dGTP pyrophosphatase MutT (NUDIX family)
MRNLDLVAVRHELRGRAVASGSEPRAAVATILREGREASELLFIKRAEHVGDPWSGHVAFPGGKREAHDESLLATSVRETEEEVGLRLSASEFVTRLGDVQARSTGYQAAQFVFALERPDAPLATNGEVTATFWVSLIRLARREGAGTITHVHEGHPDERPCLYLGEHVLWGMTYRMVMQLLEALGETP